MEPVGDAKCVLQHGHGTTLTRHGIPKRPSHSLAGQRPVLSGSSPRLLQSHAGQRPALPGAMCTRSPAGVAPIMPVTACIVGAGLKPAPTHGVLIHQTMGSTRPPHHAGQGPALPGAMCTRSPAGVAPIMPVTACIVGAGFKPAPTNDGVYPRTAPCGPAARAPRLSGDGCPTTVNIARPPLRHLPLLSYTRGNIR